MKNTGKRTIAAFLAVNLLVFSSCSAVRPVSGDPSAGAGRYGYSEKSGLTSEGITICVDAGHGFEDIGTYSEYLGDWTEKNITLSIVNELKAALEEKGFNVVLTHDGETFPVTEEDDGNRLFNPQERVSYARTLEKDYFISIHCDSYEADSSVKGTRIYYSSGTKYTKESAALTDSICSALNDAFPQDKETVAKEMAKSSAYYVIREMDCPSSLVEVGFVTNRDDAEKMLDDTWRNAIASAIAEGIYDFFAE